VTSTTITRDTQERVARALMDQIALFPRVSGEICTNMYWPTEESNPTMCMLRKNHAWTCCTINRYFKFNPHYWDQELVEQLSHLHDRIVEHDIMNCSTATCKILSAPQGYSCETVWIIYKMAGALLGEETPEWVKWFG
jgi:hypothetical protein